MKKVFVFIMTVALFFSIVGLAQAGSWPVKNYSGTPTEIKKMNNPNGLAPAFFGPSVRYSGAGAYKPKGVSNARALFREDSFVLVDMVYGNTKRCLYFRYYQLTNAEVEEAYLSAYPATVTQSVIALEGPGDDYQVVIHKAKSPYADMSGEELAMIFGGSYEIEAARKTRYNTVWVDPGASIDVFFETNGFVFAEFDSPMGKIRAWLPASAVQ